MTTPPPFQPQPCEGGGTGAAGVDVEQVLLCDTLPDGTIAGTAMAVWEYNAAGAPTGPPTFVNPATGTPYVAQGTLMPCPGETGCLEPVQFHRTTISTGPVDHPGRQYDITLPINPGFAVQSLQVDQVTSAANIVWDVSDPDGERFRQDLAAFIDARVPAAATVTITNPNAGQVICGTAAPMQIHIECLRLDQSPPDLVELIYNGGQDLVINPAYNETPPLNPPVSQGNYGFHLLGRQDNNTYPSNPPANRANCTDVANRGWETNDVGRTFEIWGKDQVSGQGVTPTPRGTPVQEMTSDGAPAGKRSTIWQTFTAPASGNFIIRVVHGARDPGEQHRITLDNGDTDDAQNGDLIDDVTTPPSVTSTGGSNPWTQFSQTIPLNGGSTYTLALSSTNPVLYNRGGLFTDMRAYIDRPDLRATATTDDDTCVVTVQETTTACRDELWSPICERGTIHSWQNAETGAILSNAAFWGQAPAPIPGPCPATAATGGGGSVAANLVHTYPVCATIGGVRTNLQRVVITDGSGGVLADSYIGPDGGPVPTPSSYDIGSCTDTAFMGDEVLCDDNGPFLRKYVQAVSAVGQPQVKAHGDFTLAGTAYTPVGTVHSCAGSLTSLGEICYSTPAGSRRGFLVRDSDGSAHVYDETGTEVTPFPTIVICPEISYFEEILCDQGNGGHPFIRRYIGSAIAKFSDTLWNFELDGSTAYAPVGPVELCGGCDDCETLVLCDESSSNPERISGAGVSSGTLPDGTAWTARSASSTPIPSNITNADGAWWGLHVFPNPVTAATTWRVSKPSVIEFSVYVRYNANPTISYAQLDPGLEVVSLPDGYSYDSTTGVLTRVSDDAPADPCSYVTDPHIATSARFRTRGPVTEVTTAPAPNSRIAACSTFFTYWAGAVTVIPTGQFLRTICRCNGATPTVTDTLLDGTTPYTPFGGVGVCTAASCCQPTQVCVTPQVIQEIQFVSNEDKVYDNSVDGTWEWAPVGAFTDPTQVATWYPTYKARFAPNPAAWSVTDSPTRASGAVNVPTAGWISPHPNGLTGSSGAPGEGPTLNAENWWARASFNLPAAADPASIKVEITVLNADQVAVRFRLNNGAWTSMPATATHNGTRYTLPPSALPGVQAGTNTLYFEVQETIPNNPNNGAGVMAHFIATYAIPGHASWTRMVCCDDTVYYIDDQGVRHDSLPDGYSIEPCGTAGEPLLLCDDNGPFLRHVSYADGAVSIRDTTLIGAHYSAVGSVHSCSASTTGGAARDEELLVLCDSTPTRFLRRYNYDATTGALIGIVNTTLDGSTPFNPVGAVGVCTTAIATDFDFVVQPLCDSNGTAFFRRLTFNSTTGAVTSTTDTTLGGAAFAPVGTVGLCSNCCPTVVGNGCTNTGSGFYTAIRSTAGAISLIDSVTGAAVAAANIIPCPSDNTVRTLTAQARLIADADTPWSPGADVVGTLTSVTMTVLSGTATLTDQNGTVLAGLPAGFTATWAVEDDNTLTGPTSIDAIGGSTVVHWTQR
ncbi:hypothetical protein [Kitasatospora aureofaciens]|uniref:hypothetical protein n=1 Tax=Kitasatospora aureofaciens TaxID=1894 RepID=UPI0033F54172